MKTFKGYTSIVEGSNSSVHKKGNFVVVYTSEGYKPSITVIPRREAPEFFNENYGWEPEDIEKILNLKSNENFKTGAIHIIKF